MSQPFSAAIPALPQHLNNEQQQARSFELSIAKTAYNYMFSYLEPIPISASVPKEEKFTPEYEAKVLKVFLPILENFKDVVMSLLKKEIAGDLPAEAITSIAQVEAAYAQLKQDKASHSPLKVVKEVQDLHELIMAMADLPKVIEQAFKNLGRLPADLVKILEGLNRVFKEFETEGFTAFLKNTMYDILDSSQGRCYLQAESLKEYELLFKGLPRPMVLDLPKKEWMAESSPEDICMQDWYFAYMQIAGFNTTNLKAVRLDQQAASSALILSQLQTKMPITDEIFQQVVGERDISLADAAEKGKLYACDYSLLASSEGSTLHDLQRFPEAPIALFYWNETPPAGYPKTGALQPIAIQLGQKYDVETCPIFTHNDCTNNNDADGSKWKLAKIAVQNACTIQHETVAHLGACHLTLEPMIVAAHRQLPKAHPLMVLLTPHFRFTLEINDGALHSLIVPGGVVASVISTSHQATGELLVRAHEAWKFDEQFPDRLFQDRGVSHDTLPSFPFREDTLELWSAINRFVKNYLSLYYTGEDASEKNTQVKHDYELQNWVNEMVNQKYACVKGMDGLTKTGDDTRPYQIDDFDYLVKLVSLIIYTGSAQHAAVNFAQYPLMSYIPNATGTLYKAAPTRSETLSQKDVVSWLPPLDVALYQVSFAYLLTGVQYDSLGHYSENPRVPYFKDSRVAPLLSQFQMELNQAEIEIHQRNNQRPLPYLFQLPSMVPNSISI
ncbi:MAG: lipoxygenase family protein [Oleiphilus sp.]